MSISKIFITIIVSFLVSSVLLYRPMVMDWAIRNEMEQVAETKLSLERSELYIPQGVTVLKEAKGMLPPNSFRALVCVSASVSILYGTNRSNDEIREEYSQALTRADWELNPGYEPGGYYIVYRKGDGYHLTIDLLEDFREPMGKDFKVIYSVFLAYVTPPYNDCIMG